MHLEDHESIFQTILVFEPVFNAILVENHRNLVPIVFFPFFCYRNLKKTKMQEKKQKNTFFSFSCQRKLKPVFYTKIISKFDKWPLKVQIFTRNLPIFRFLVEFGKKWLESSQNRGIAQKGLFFYLTPGIDLSNNFGLGKCFCYIGCVFLSDIQLKTQCAAYAISAQAEFAVALAT